MNTFFRPPEPFQYDSLQSMVSKWKIWKKEFQTFMIATENTGKDDTIKVSMFINLIGQQGNELYESFTWVRDGDDKKLDTVLKKFDDHMKGTINVTVNRFEFFKYDQRDGQTIDDFIKELTLLRKDCNFADDNQINDTLLRDKIICGLKDKALQEKLLRLEPAKSTLNNVITCCRLHEISKDHSAKLDIEEHSVNQIFTRPSAHQGRNYGNRRTGFSATSAPWINNCRFCATSHPKGQCKAYNQRCTYCNMKNHIVKACESKKRDEGTPTNRQAVHSIEEDSTTSDKGSDVFHMSQIETETNQGSGSWSVQLWVENEKVKFKIDSGADVSVISYGTFKNLPSCPKITKTNTRLKAYNQTDIPVIGRCILQVQHQDKQPRSIEFMIADYESVISGKHSEELQLIQKLFAVTKLPEGIKEDIFDEIGCIEGELEIYMNEGVKPVVQPPRRIPHAMMGKLKAELDRMQSMGVIYDIQEPTDWVSSLVVQTKDNGKLRICLDPKYLNMAIKRQHYPIPTTEHIFDKLGGATVFSKLDCSSGYWQIKVTSESSKLLCFNTPFGRYCFLRLPFGIHIASEIFQQKLEAVLEGLPGVANSQDDMIVWGKDQAEHDQRLRKVMEKIYMAGFRLNREKCKLGVSDLIFLGHRVTSKGIYPDPSKITAIKEMEIPKDKKGVQRLLGMVNYVSKFIPEASHITAPLRKLIEKDTKFEITSEHKESIQRIKEALVSNPVLKIYEASKETKITCDASLYGLGAVLMQKHGADWLPVAYASRSLTDAEKRYAQIEKETLSAVFACNKFHNYVFGRHFTIENDHKPLQSIIKKDLSQMPARIARMMMVLMKYPDLTFRYVPGSHLKIADTLSRAPERDATPEVTNIEHQVHAVYSSLPATDEIKMKFKEATEKDGALQIVAKYAMEGWPEQKECPKHVQHYWSLRDEITIHQGIIYKAQQMIVPTTMREYVKEKVHMGHLGIVKCKARAKTYFYWPGMAREIEQVVYRCGICQEYRNRQPMETNMAVTATRPWSIVGTDVFHYQQFHYLIMTDYYSSYPEVILLNKGSAHGTSHATIEKMKQLFSRHGIPELLKSDGGPQFISKEFQEFAKSWNFTHDPSSPEYPKGNGRVERSVQTVKKLIKKAVESKSSIEAAILAYRTTPLQDCGHSPAELLMGRQPRNHLNSHIRVESNESPERKGYTEKYANLHARDMPELRPGDKVRIYDRAKKKYATKAVVEKQHGNPRSYIVESETGHTYRRNRRDLLKTQEPFCNFKYRQELLEDDSSDNEYDNEHDVNNPRNDNAEDDYLADMPGLEDNAEHQSHVESETDSPIEESDNGFNSDHDSSSDTSERYHSDPRDYRRFTLRKRGHPNRWGYAGLGKPRDSE